MCEEVPGDALMVKKRKGYVCKVAGSLFGVSGMEERR